MMKHPEALLLPVLMLADYYLTVLGAVQRDKKYSQHFKTPLYELNPLWQKQIQRKQWFSPRHTILALTLSALLIYLVEHSRTPAVIREGMLGCVLTVYTSILGRHISNLLIFRRMIRKPDEVTGEVTMAHRFVLSLSLYQSLMVLFPILLIALLSQSPYAIGGALGIGLFLAVHRVWIRKSRTRKTAPA
jgi:hypothetical protein